MFLDLGKIWNRIFDHLDLIGAVLGVLLGTIIILLGFFTGIRQQDIGSAILASSAIYLILRSRLRKTRSLPNNAGDVERIMLNIIFFTVLSLVFILQYQQLYFRPFSYFILISLLAGILGTEILYFAEGTSFWPIVIKTLLLSTVIRAGIFYNFPSIMGYDAYVHMNVADIIANTGSVPPPEISGKYFYYPIFQIFIAAAQVIGQIGAKDAIFFSIGIASIVITIFIYFIGKMIDGPRVGLLAALLANLTYDFIVMGMTDVNPGSLVLCYFIIMLYLMLKDRNDKDKSQVKPMPHGIFSGYKVLIIFFTLLMVITHQLSTFVVLVSLMFMYAGIYIYHVFRKREKYKDISMALLILFSMAILFYWNHTYVTPGVSFFSFVMDPLIQTLESGGQYGSNLLIVGYDYNLGLLNTLILHLSYLILPFLTIGGVLLWITAKDARKFGISLAAMLLYVIIYGIPLLGMRNLLTDRWMPFLAVFLVIISASYILKFIGTLRWNAVKAFTIFMIVALFAFFMITTPGINKDDPLVAKNTTVRNQFKASEVLSADTLSQIYNGAIKVDYPYVFIFYQFGMVSGPYDATRVFDSDFINSTTPPDNSMVVLRKSTVNEPISVQNSKLFGDIRSVSLPQGFFDRYEGVGYDRLFDSGGILGYLPDNNGK